MYSFSSILSIVGGLCLALPVILVQSHPAVWNYRIQAEAVWNYRIQAVFFQVKVSQTWTWQWPTWLGCPDYYNQFHMVDCGRVWDICVTLFDAKREHNGRCERPCVSPFSSAKHLFFGPNGLSILYLFYKNTQFWNTLNFCWDPTSHVYHSQLTKRYNFCLPYIKAKHLVAR